MSVAGLLEAATALVLLWQESHQISRCLHSLQHQGVCRKGKPRSWEEEKALVWLYPPSRPRLCQPNPGVSQQVCESPRSKDGGGGVLGGRRLDREYGARGHCGRTVQWLRKKFGNKRALLCPLALPFISRVTLDRLLSLSGPQCAPLSD